MDPITLPMTIPELRVEGAPVLITLEGRAVSGLYLFDGGDGYSLVRTSNGTWARKNGDIALDLHHPNGERIADLVLRPCPPTADRETLEGIRDAVLRAVSA